MIKNPMALERMRTIDVVLFDKTGTLTKGEPSVTKAMAVDGVTTDELLALAGAIESDSEHHLASASVAAAGPPGRPPLRPAISSR
ncbi:HAD family hydrolase [Arthrobacter sp. STN4]|uniref:HAD family hydrolase n=1 Tax=Arthrobacter sp. STN4 TaxID=2923276 RepID=UPI002119C29B|nr:HAD family hydrolase [Arthrobacter sp. STN4]MCQ9164202.1 HAD family hydrolase [Arthrobacter sp. STN4]